eukprot:gene25947-32458_t
MSEFANLNTTEEYAIAYTNGNPHIGHAYESISTDVLARLHRVLGYDTLFITGTDEHGQKVAASAEKGDIFLDQYTGWYNEREELFVTQVEAEATDFKDPVSGVPLKQVAEESYFFRMSRYCERLIAYIEENPTFIEPEVHRNVILGRLRKEGLKDLSISRTSFSWGIPVPE